MNYMYGEPRSQGKGGVISTNIPLAQDVGYGTMACRPSYWPQYRYDTTTNGCLRMVKQQTLLISGRILLLQLLRRLV